MMSQESRLSDRTLSTRRARASARAPLSRDITVGHSPLNFVTICFIQSMVFTGDALSHTCLSGMVSVVHTPVSSSPPSPKSSHKARRMWRTCVFCDELFNFNRKPSKTAVQDASTREWKFRGVVDDSVARGVCDACLDFDASSDAPVADPDCDFSSASTRVGRLCDSQSVSPCSPLCFGCPTRSSADSLLPSAVDPQDSWETLRFDAGWVSTKTESCALEDTEQMHARIQAWLASPLAGSDTAVACGVADLVLSGNGGPSEFRSNVPSDISSDMGAEVVKAPAATWMGDWPSSPHRTVPSWACI